MYFLCVCLHNKKVKCRGSKEGYAARGEICANRSAWVRIIANIASRRRYREYYAPRDILCGGGMRTPRLALRAGVRPL